MMPGPQAGGLKETAQPRLARRVLPGAIVLLLVLMRPAAASDDAVWAASYDAASRTRYIPLELILGAPWDGRREIAMPAGDFTEGVPLNRNPSTWHGPVEWQHPETGAKLMIYDRSRRGVVQKFAVRTDGTAIGRVADNRNDISSCDQEGKYPLGLWRQGETRQFDYRCWRGTGGATRVTDMITTITIDEIDFSYAGAAHSLQVHWILRHKGEAREVDNRVYVFAPGRGVVYVK
ncbi:MAG TPA: hypothetical protein VMU85_13830 [Stellaceae bacterium]|nr:hypothetical protein [Stellaceae bacterium]